MTKNKDEITNKRISFDMNDLDAALDLLIKKYPFINVISIGQTTLGRAIPLISIGSGKKTVLYVGGMGAKEGATSKLLMKFLCEYCECIRTQARVYGYNTAYLEHMRSISIIPMLNADGIDYQSNGIDKESPVYQYLLRTCGEKFDDEDWQGNARGVDLKSNFSNTYERSSLKEMESESGALRNFLMFNRDIRLVLTFSVGDAAVTYTNGERRIPRLDPLGRALGYMCASDFEKYNTSGTLCQFCSDELTVPSFDIRSKYTYDGFQDYSRLRKLLFVSQTLI